MYLQSIKIHILLILLSFNAFLEGSEGTLVGQVIDADTHQPLVGANVVINNYDIGAACDLDGKFRINNIETGSYTVSASMIGYSALSKININIYSDRQTPIKFQLKRLALEGEKVVVHSSYFERAKDGIISTQTIDREEIRSDPIGAYDIQMMVHSLPSVVTGTDQNNEIIVRGGGPGENLFIMDNLEIPNPNHFGEVGTGGGPVNIINTEFVERIDFFAGGYPSKYGDKQSSVMEVHLRDGNYNDYDIDLEMSMAGLGFLIEGPLINDKSSFISSYRKSFVKYLIKSAGLVSVPEYSNTQHKATYNIDRKNKIIFNFVGGFDNVDIVGENRPDLKGAENVNYSGYQYTAGITYKSLFSQKGYYLLSLGKTSASWDANVYNNDNGVIDPFFVRNNIESDSFIKFDIVFKVNSKSEISFGLNSKYGQYKIKESLDPDTLYVYEYPNLNNEQIEQINNFSNYHDLILAYPEYTHTFDDYIMLYPFKINSGFINYEDGALWKHASYFQFKYKWKKLLLTTGLRYDNVRLNSSSIFSPRIGLEFLFSPITKFNIAFGQYYQSPSYWMLMNPNNEHPLKHSYTAQAVAGFEHLLAEDTRLTFEIYHKNYYNRPVKQSDISLDSLDNRLGFIDIGTGYSEGIEVFVQKKFASKWYGTISYSYSDSKAKDYRINQDGYYPWDYDSKSGLTVVGGYKFKFNSIDWYNKIRKSNSFLFFAWIPFFPSDQLEISFRYRYSGGLPYTPKTYDFILREWYTDINKNLNSARYNDYSRLDIMFLRRFNFKNINLITFIDLQNIFNRNNEWERVYLEDGTFEMSYQYKQIPVGGIIIEF